MEKIKFLFAAHKTTVFLIVILGVLGILGWFGYQMFFAKPVGPVEEVDLQFDAEGPYAILSTRRDGNALVLNLKRTASYDVITYELSYPATYGEIAVQGGKILEKDKVGDPDPEGVADRGVIGTIDTKEKKGEYEQEIIFGSCSKNVCVYDKAVENGTLTLHIKKADKAYRMVTQWRLQRPDVALGRLASGDGHLVYKLDSDRQQLSAIGFSIINDLTGVPKLPGGKAVFGKVYSLNAPIAKSLSDGLVTFELAENPPSGAKLARYDESRSEER